MAASPLDPHQATPAELKARIAATRRGVPFVILREGAEAQRIVVLERDRPRLTIGRSEEADIRLDRDGEVSRLHAQLELIGDSWFVVDDGISRNGSFVRGQRVVGRRRLEDGDDIRVGKTVVAFRHPVAPGARTTIVSGDGEAPAGISPAQRRVLLALCRPYRDGELLAVPAGNDQIAAELFLTVAAVKTHLRALYQAFAIDDLPQGQKRQRLAASAVATGVVSVRDLAGRPATPAPSPTGQDTPVPPGRQ